MLQQPAGAGGHILYGGRILMGAYPPGRVRAGGAPGKIGGIAYDGVKGPLPRGQGQGAKILLQHMDRLAV